MGFVITFFPFRKWALGIRTQAGLAGFILDLGLFNAAFTWR